MIDNFEIIDNVLFRKKPLDLLLGDECSQWVVNKGISFYSSSMVQYINATSNVYGKCLDSQQFVDYLNLIIPKVKYKKTEWLKNAKNQKTKIPELAQLAAHYECSQRELLEVYACFPELIEESQEDNLKKYTKKSK